MAVSCFPFSRELLESTIQEGDLEFEANTIIQILSKEESGWWKGSIGERVGVFPSSFVKSDCLLKTSVTHSYTPQREDEIQLSVGDQVKVYEDRGNGWFRVAFKKSAGLYPSSHLADKKLKLRRRKSQPIVTNRTLSPVEKENPRSMTSVRQPSPRLSVPNPILPVQDHLKAPDPEKRRSVPTGMPAKVIKAYEAAQPGDLSLVVGQVVSLTKCRGLWWEGVYEGERGIFPSKCVLKME